MTRRRALEPGVRRALRLGAVEREHAPARTTVHVAGGVIEGGCHEFGERMVQRCNRCGRILAEVSGLDVVMLDIRASTAKELRERLAARFFPEGRRIAEGTTANYLVSDRPLGADETECEDVPPFAWPD